MENVELKNFDTDSEREQKEKNKEEEIKLLNSQNKKESDSFEMKTTNVLFSVMSVTSIIGTILIVLYLEEILEPLKQARPDYQFPSVYDFRITLIAFVIFCVRKINNKMMKNIKH